MTPAPERVPRRRCRWARSELPQQIANRGRFGRAAPDWTADGVGGELQQGLVSRAAADHV